MSFILGYFLQKLMAKFYENLRKLRFELILGQTKFFSRKSTFVAFLLLNFYRCAEFQKKTNKEITRKN